jgi:hypothetical protein
MELYSVVAANQLGFAPGKSKGVRLVFGKSAHDEDEASGCFITFQLKMSLTRTGPPRIAER